MALSPTDFLRLALDPDRLAVLGLAASGPIDIEQAAHRLSLTVGQVRRAVSRLAEAGLLDEDLSLDRAALREIAEALPGEEPISPSVLDGPWTAEERQLLSRYFVGSRLAELPTQASRRRVVLERLAHEFEVGIRYTEKRVNSIILTFHPDYAAIRRYLIDEGFLSRADGAYWRSGGRIDA
ncbi:MAG: DUF2087 domain-containing protein [Acidimicrobiia bacterium]|nr:DUF2087 domain-containing protein [Acidimicrobiia bacterium]